MGRASVKKVPDGNLSQAPPGTPRRMTMQGDGGDRQNKSSKIGLPLESKMENGAQ